MFDFKKNCSFKSSLFHLQGTNFLVLSLSRLKPPVFVLAKIFLTLLKLSTPNHTGYIPSTEFSTEIELNFLVFIFFRLSKILSQ